MSCRMSRPRLPTLALFAVLLLTYGYFIRTARDENSNSRLGLIFAVAREGRLTIDSFHQHPWLHTIDKAYHGGHYYSDKAPGTAVPGVLAYAPVYHAARALGLDTDTWSAFSRTKYFLTVIVAGIPSALAGAMVFAFLFRITGIPYTERQALRSRADYAEYQRSVSVFLPWFPKK